MISGRGRGVCREIFAQTGDFGSYRGRVRHCESVCDRNDRVLRRGRRGTELPLLGNLVVRFPVDVLETRLRGVDFVGRRVQRLVECVVKISLCLVQGGVGHVTAMRSIREPARSDLHEVVGHST
jgi:hypothetical protein